MCTYQCHNVDFLPTAPWMMNEQQVSCFKQTQKTNLLISPVGQLSSLIIMLCMGVFELDKCFISAGWWVLRCRLHRKTHTYLESGSSHATSCTAAPAPSLITPHRHLCCGTSRSSTQSCFIFHTHDLWNALWPLQGCSPWTLTTQALLRHLSPTRKRGLSNTKQLGLACPGLSLWGK